MSVLLALLHAGVARKEAFLVQRRPDGLIVASQGPRNTVPDRARLPGVAAPVHRRQDVESPLGVRDLQRLQDAVCSGSRGKKSSIVRPLTRIFPLPGSSRTRATAFLRRPVPPATA